MGASVSVKWTGLGYFLAAILLLIVIYIYQKLFLQWHLLLFGFVIVPLIFYLLQWLPHLALNPDTSLLEVHQQIFNFHQNLGGREAFLAHPYCSQWWSWVFMIRTVAYFFEFRNLGIVFVNGMGNPLLYWFSAGAVLYSLIKMKLSCANQGLSIYLGLAFLANLLPWMLAKRCTFLYHYMPASVFAFIALAVIADLCLGQKKLYPAGVIICSGVAIAFVMWLPVFIGLPISPHYWRMIIWMPTWI